MEKCISIGRSDRPPQQAVVVAALPAAGSRESLWHALANRDPCSTESVADLRLTSEISYQVSPPEGGGHAHSLCRNVTTWPR